ncbi:histidine--tRNA ligase family protein [Nitratireductor mangrovi]|uniref:Histidine--tRNA ligase n=1 Tax=Nitratireductor mangrovi TaxID=2599600 RepID=A0A5B8KYY7_9HYPH|nr:HisS family protein [Nitratireductor mangrovi]QDZ00791.1 histidine--tRNA ligase family protein [Nitratireductor mangrovi]
MSGKPIKMKARLPRGLVDRTPADIRAVDEMCAKIRAVYELYGFEPVETPLIEYTDALGKFLPDQDRPNEGVFSFQDDDEQWLSLRYDLTAPLARYVAENFERLAKPYRSYRAGWVFRNEKPGPGRFRQFMQFDADTVGTPGVAADAEMAMMMADVMEAVGIKRGDYVIRVNNRKVLDGVMEAIGLGGEENAGRRLTVLRAIDKLDKFGPEGVKLLLGEGRWDGGKEGEGDFTTGAGLDQEQIQPLIELANFKETLAGIRYSNALDDKVQFPMPFREHPTKWGARENDGQSNKNEMRRKGETLMELVEVPEDVGDTWNLDNLSLFALVFNANRKIVEGLNELAEIATLAFRAGYHEDRVLIDPSVVRGLEYYTGPVYEAELLAEIPNEDGVVVRFGSVGGGGRYDGLVSRFRGEPVPATGFSIGVSRLMTALKNLGKLDAADAAGPVVVLAMDKDTDSLGRYQKMVAELRAAGIRAEMYLGGAGMKAQMKYADRRRAPCVVIQGGDERERGEVQIKDLVEGARQARAIAGHEEYKEARPGQVSVPEAELVATVERIIEAQKAERDGR